MKTSERDFRSLWLLDPEVAYLNHGSFGACPKAVLERQSELRAQLEREPVQFLARRLEPMLDEARSALAEFVGADPSGLVFVPNATAALNTVLRWLDLGPDDELLTTEHAYPSCAYAMERTAAVTGASLVVAEIPFPIAAAGDVTEAVLSRVTRRTRICVIDHVTSPTALIFPVAEIVSKLKERGVVSLVDGAHAPGMLPLDLGAISADFYTGNCHKWLCAPKGSAFLSVAPKWRDSLRPLATSLGAGSTRRDRPRLHLEFDWAGTHDPSAYLCVPEAIRFMGSLLPSGWPELMSRNRDLALSARRMIAGTLDAPLPCPDEMMGAMASLELPQIPAKTEPGPDGLDPLQAELYEKYGIEVPVIRWPQSGGRLIRLSAQIYNGEDDYDRLASALGEILRLSEPR